VSRSPSDGLVVLYEDAELLVIDKPSGLSVHRGWAAHEPDYVVDRVARALGRRAFPVHRLDRGTSGVLVLAKDADAARALGRQVEAHALDKRYLALVRGAAPEALTIDHALAAEPGRDRKPAVTELSRLEVVTPAALGRAYSLIEARPKTGRLHQIRRHLKHIACPIIGDVNYGKGDQNRAWREAFGLHRLALHAHRLGLEHPTRGERLELVAPLPPDLAGPLAAAGFTWAGLGLGAFQSTRPAPGSTWDA